MFEYDTTVKGLPAPYNFVPLAAQVCTDWGVPPSQDIPFEDGLSGCLELTITAHAPLLVSGGDQSGGSEKIKSFYRLPDGTFAIPGTSLRGMIRNILEIISFSRFQLVDDRRFGLRDLTAAARLDYGEKFTENLGDRTYEARSKAGWLTFDPGNGWQIQPCEYARIDHSQFRYLRPAFHSALMRIRGERNQEARQAAKLYEAWEKDGRAMEQMNFQVEPEPTLHAHSPGHLKYREAFAPGRQPSGRQTEQRSGTVVFTGLPSRRKHLEFVFLEPKEGTRPASPDLPPEIWVGFLDVHERQEKESPTWKFWLELYQRRKVDRIPVFYLEEEGQEDKARVCALGLALMFKLAQELTTHDMIRATGGDHLPLEPEEQQTHRTQQTGELRSLDLAERLFGRVDDRHSSLKGRVSFSMARLVPGSPPQPEVHPAIMGAPKPSYFPAYVRQVDLAAGSGAKLASTLVGGREQPAQYRTYMRRNGQANELRGWKRYPARIDLLTPTAPKSRQSDEESKTEVTLKPLRPGGLRFAATLRFHNLRPFELGALAWTLDWGERDNLRHSLGMGKAFGWGQIAIQVKLTALIGDDSEPAAAFAAARAAFVERMDGWIAQRGIAKNWLATPQMHRLMAMADPASAPHNALRYMTLDPELGPPGNEFLEAKRQGLVLREYWDSLDQHEFERRGARASARPARVGAPTTSTPLFRKGDVLLSLETQERVAVVADQFRPGDLVHIRYPDGEEENVQPRILARL